MLHQQPCTLYCPYSSTLGIRSPCVGSTSLHGYQCIGGNSEVCYKICTTSWKTKYTDLYHVENDTDTPSSHSPDEINFLKQCHLYKLVHGLSVFLTLLLPQLPLLPLSSLIRITLALIITILYVHVPSSVTLLLLCFL